jgi:hypothetical protein
VTLLNNLKNKVMGSYEQDKGLNQQSKINLTVEIEEKLMKK